MHYRLQSTNFRRVFRIIQRLYENEGTRNKFHNGINYTGYRMDAVKAQAIFVCISVFIYFILIFTFNSIILNLFLLLQNSKYKLYY